MTDAQEAPPDRADRIQQKLDHFAASVDKRVDEMNEGDEVLRLLRR